MNYNNRKFRPVSNSENGIVSNEMIFHYMQSGNILTCSYSGEKIISGHLIGLVDEKGQINMSYHQIDNSGKLMTGICNSTPKINDSGKIILHEKWQWTSGDKSEGYSVLEEI